MSKRYEMVIFDLDGTLLNTIGDIADATNAVLAEAGFPAHSEEQLKAFIGEGIEEFVFRALPEGYRSGDNVDEYVRKVREEYRKRWNIRTQPYPGIPELLDMLAAENIVLAVLSNKPMDFTRMMVAEMLQRWPFSQVRGASPDIPRKPHPAGALMICRAMGISPEKTLFVGDSETDIETARNAGMQAVGAAWGFRSRRQLEDAGAGIVADSPRDVISIFQDLQYPLRS